MKIPGYVTVYKDSTDGFIHLYFYPGYDNGEQIIRLDLKNYDWKFIVNQDKSIDYKFTDTNISEIEYSIINCTTNIRRSIKWQRSNI